MRDASTFSWTNRIEVRIQTDQSAGADGIRSRMPVMRMKSVSRSSISEEFEVSSECPVPETPKGGARIKVYYAGACYTDKQVEMSGQKRLRSPGVQNTSLFPGYEVSGIVDEVCNTSAEKDIQTGDRVIVYPEDKSEECILEGTYAEYITIKNIGNLIKIPSSLRLQVASLLPSGALRGYAAILRAKPFVEMKVATTKNPVNILIVGAGGLGLWTLKMTQYFISSDKSKVKTSVADTNIDKLMIAKDHGCVDVIHWNDAIHEGYILQRTKDVCPGGVDVIIDFVSSPRTVSRALKVLNREGILLVGGNSKYEVSVSPAELAANGHSIIGVPRGTKQQLEELVDICAQGLIDPPVYRTYSVDEANEVFDMLNECKIDGRAILELCPEEDEGDGEEGEFSVFLPNSDSAMDLDGTNGHVTNGAF